ncbi:MAG: hypothetical protein PHD31_02870 [Candidatus Pacebacteria bacterium]|nr:hypothetical protein [Candidatus Paceibacterota bacterium]
MDELMQKSNNFKIFVSIVLVIMVIVVGVFLYFKANIMRESVKVITEKGSYNANEELKLDIENNAEESMCFSSCYPYLMQENEGNWKFYNYSSCGKEDVVEKCISPKDLKAFGITLDATLIKSALSRLAIPACIGCNIGDKFRVDKIFYSNEFEINK